MIEGITTSLTQNYVSGWRTDIQMKEMTTEMREMKTKMSAMRQEIDRLVGLFERHYQQKSGHDYKYLFSAQ